MFGVAASKAAGPAWRLGLGVHTREKRGWKSVRRHWRSWAFPHRDAKGYAALAGFFVADAGRDLEVGERQMDKRGIDREEAASDGVFEA
jgi:hypothetical protein